jgi:DNA (cytosine-5)-methyltransferase 1
LRRGLGAVYGVRVSLERDILWAEFFAGGGMVRAALGAPWRCVLANDIDPEKGGAYAANWGADHLRVCDVAAVTPDDLPEPLDLVWASSPCQNLSLAGGRAGLSGERSAAFWPWWRLMRALGALGRRPRVIAFENVAGLLSARGGSDFAAVAQAFADGGYRLGAFWADAAWFLPQSRPRLLLVALRDDVRPPPGLIAAGPEGPWAPRAVSRAADRLPDALRARWVWWRLPPPPGRNAALADLLEPRDAVAWNPPDKTARLLAMMAPPSRARVAEALAGPMPRAGAVFRRMRDDGAGGRAQRAEARFDGLAGCLRTPAGGSSRQTVLWVEGGEVRSRLLTPREAARLMGLPDDYRLPARDTAAWRLAGDGVAVPLVAFVARHLLSPLARGATPRRAAA